MMQATVHVTRTHNPFWIARILLVATLVVLANLVTPPATAQAASIGIGDPATVSCKSVFEHSMHVDVSASAAPGLAFQNLAARILIFDRIAWKFLPVTAWKGFTHQLQTWVIDPSVGGAYLQNHDRGYTEFNFSPPSLPGGYYNLYTQYAWLDSATGTWSVGNYIYTQFYKQDGQYLWNYQCVTF